MAVPSRWRVITRPAGGMRAPAVGEPQYLAGRLERDAREHGAQKRQGDGGEWSMPGVHRGSDVRPS